MSEFQRIPAEEAESILGQPQGLPSGWETPEPFALRDADRFAAPMWVFPENLRRLVSRVAQSKQVTTETVVASMMGILSAICAGRYCATLAQQYTTHAHVWILLALRSAGGKSEALSVFQKPVYRAQKRLQSHVQAQNDRNAAERAALAKGIAAMEAGAPEEYPGQLSEARERLADVAQKRLPRFFWKDVSPQKIDVLYATYQRVIIVSGESEDWFSLIMGRGKDQGPTLGSCLSGWSVEPHGSDRISREESHCERPVLSLFLANQEVAVRQFVADPVARQRGFLGRTLVVMGNSLVGGRLPYDQRPELTSSDLLSWETVVDVVTQEEPPSDSDGWLPLEIPVDPKARNLFARLFEVVERRLGEDSPDLQLADIEDIAGRSLEQVGRLSVLLHVLWTASRRVSPTAEPIAEETVLRGFGLMIWALGSFLDLSRSSVSTDHAAALELWQALDQSELLGTGRVTLKSWLRLGPVKWRSTVKVEPLLRILQELGYIELSTRKNARGPSSRVIELNPLARGVDPEIAATVATVCENPLFADVIQAQPHLRRFATHCDGMPRDVIPSQTCANRRSEPCAGMMPSAKVFADNVATVAGVSIHEGADPAPDRPLHPEPLLADLKPADFDF